MHGPSLQGFLAWLAAGEAEVKRDLDQRGRDEVRIMTVHGAKGLQAPIVFLPDTLQVPTRLPSICCGARTDCRSGGGRAGGAPAFGTAKARRRNSGATRNIGACSMSR